MDLQKIEDIKNQIDKIADEMYDLMSELYPICRSITGDGVRETDKIISNYIPIEIFEIPTGTKVFDWVIPKEWNIKDAYVKNSNGKKIIDFKNSNLHVVNYSVPINKKISFLELKEHLFTIPEQPDVIPYLTSYYKENWGFCLSHNEFLKLKDEQYEVVIDSKLEDGYLTYAEYFLPGQIKDEILISTYTCHPSLCNDGLSGPVIVTFLAKYLSQMDRRFSYRFVFIPETIGAITWLSKNKDKVKNIKSCFVITCGGDPGNPTYRKTLQGNEEIDRAVTNILKYSGSDFKIIDYFPPGSDERQYSSPSFKIPTGLLMRTTFPDFPEYHTSGDNLNFVKGEYLADTFLKHLQSLFILEENRTYVSLNPDCEPQLGKRGLYKSLGSQKDGYLNEFALIALLTLADGKNSLLDISERSNIDFKLLFNAAKELLKVNLIKES